MKGNNLFILLLITISFFQCKDDENVSVDTPQNIPNSLVEENKIINAVLDPTEVKTKLKGLIQNENGEALEGASVFFGDEEVLTNEEGIFVFENAINAKKQNGFVRVVKDGFLEGFRSFKPNESEENFVKIQMLFNNQSATVSATDGGTIELDGMTLTFSNESFVHEDGSMVDGNVKVVGRYIDPNADNFLQIMPGSLLGIREDKELVLLQSFGMGNIQLFDSENNEVRIADNKTVELKMPAIVNSPNEIPLWHFNEIHGIWVQSGTATKSDNEYIAEVSHFSTWNLDLDEEGFTIDLQVLDTEGIPMSNAEVKVSLVNGFPIGTFVLDSDGKISLERASQSQKMLIEPIVNCGQVLPIEIEPITENTSKVITASFPTIKGSVRECDLVYLKDKSITLIYDDNGNKTEYQIITNGNGEFNLALNCNHNNGEFYVTVDGNESNKITGNRKLYNFLFCEDEINDLNSVITFNNSVIEDSIRAQHNYSGLLTKEFLNSIESLDLSRSDIEDIQDLENFPNLVNLNLRNNNISNITLLSSLKKLQRLDLWGNSIVNLEGISGLNNLTRLFLGRNSIEDFDELSGLYKLNTLYLNHNHIVNLSALENLVNLKFLFLGNNLISDISSLEKLTKLNQLTLNNNQITDISVLENFNQLSFISLTSNQLLDISILLDILTLNNVFICHGNNIPQSQINQLASKFPDLETDCWN